MEGSEAGSISITLFFQAIAHLLIIDRQRENPLIARVDNRSLIQCPIIILVAIGIAHIIAGIKFEALTLGAGQGHSGLPGVIIHQLHLLGSPAIAGATIVELG